MHACVVRCQHSVMVALLSRGLVGWAAVAADAHYALTMREV